MKHAPSSTLALANLLLSAVLAISTFVLLARVDVSEWYTWDPRWLSGMEWGVVPLGLVVLVAMPCVTLGLALFDYWRGFRRQALLSAAISSLLLLVPVSWMAFGDRLASYQEARADRAWAKTLESMDAFQARYPEAPASESAARLRAAAARIGLDLRPSDAGDGRPRDPDRNAYQAVRERLAAFASSQTRKADDALEAPPPEVSAWLSDHDAGIAALVGEVGSEDAIVFATDWSSREPVASILGVKDVVCVLIVRALERERQGDSKGAVEALEASWRIGGAFRGRGEVISQLIAVGIDSMTMSALRKLRNPPHASPVGLAEHDYLVSMLRALEGQAWEMSADATRLAGAGRARPGARRMRLRVERPYVRLMASDFSLVVGHMVAELKTADPCRMDPDTLIKKFESSLGSWNLLGRMAIPSLIRAWFSAGRPALEAELTQKVLAARALRNEDGGWPAELAGLDSAVCRGSHWVYSNHGDDGVSLTQSPNPSLGEPLVFWARVR